MLTWRGVALGVGLCVGLVAACGDDPVKRTVRGSEAGAGGGDDVTAGSGAGPTPSASGAGGEGGGAVQARVDLASYCQTIGETYSAWLTFCYGSDAYPESEAAEFAANSESSCLVVAPEVAAGRLAFDEVAAAGCLAAIDTMNCDGFTFVEGWDECRNVFAGLVEVGDPCYSGATHFSISRGECAGGYCDVSGQACPGECVASKQNDEACESSSECVPESWCSDGVCAPRLEVGDACDVDACPLGSSCVTPFGETGGQCVARSQAGQACSSTERCSSGFQCLNGECRSKVATGEPCVFRWNCADGERCLDREGDGRTCGPPGGADVPCDSSADCQTDHYCGFAEPKLCLPRVAIGLACTQDGQCAEGSWCNLESGECQASGAEGDSCLQNGFPAGAPAACEGDLKCMNDGQCHPVGAEGEPCRPTNSATCSAGLYCRLADATCQPPAEQGEPCNPYSPVSCADELGCACDDAACTLNDFSLPHSCAPRRADGDACFSTAECAIGSSCLGVTEGECIPDPTPCLPE